MSIKVAIIKYNAGNVLSVQYALERIGVDSIITDNEFEIRNASHVIFPGVGHAASAMENIKQKGLDKIVKELTQPVLGICLGLQLMCRYSAEGETTCLGIFDADVHKFETETLDATFKIPQVGWNNISDLKTSLFHNIPEQSSVYTVHSYYASLTDQCIATTDYILPYSAALQKDNFYAVQFHPEKSGAVGEAILKNFISINNVQ